MNFAVEAVALRQQEIARIRDAIAPRLHQLRRMEPETFRAVIADMLHRFGHTIIISDPTAPRLVTTKGEKKFITACAAPTGLIPTGTRELASLHDAVIAANAARGFFITARSFTDAADHYAETAPLDLIDGNRLIKALNQSRKHLLMPQTYQAMCCQCGEIVQHRLDREHDEARPCSNGHTVAPTIARDMLLPPKLAAPGTGSEKQPAPRPYSRREIRAHNAKYEARMMKKPPAPF
jgi:hypothetical protein